MANGRKNGRGKAILAILLCLPLVFIAYFAITYSSQSVSLDNVREITVAPPDKDQAVFKSQEDIDFYVNMLSSSLSINTPMRDVSKEKPVYITYARDDKSIEYKLYPSLNLSGCLLVSPEDKLYMLPTETAKQLLLREEYDHLYSAYFLPTLSVVSGNNVYPVAPIECNWNYFKSDGVSYTYTPDTFAKGDEVYTIIKGLENKLDFSPNGESMPYELSNISYVAENGTEYNISDISELDLSVDTRLTVSFTASWSSKNGAQASGEAKYKFDVMYDIPATIDLGKTDYSVGDVIEINASHLNADEQISLETLLDVSDIRFEMVGDDNGVALIPIGRQNAAGNYSLKVTTGLGSAEQTVIVSGIEQGAWKPIDITVEQYDEMLSIEKMDAFYETLAGVSSTRPDKASFVYGETPFVLPVGDKTPIYKYGQAVNLGVTDISGDSGERVCDGIVYELAEGSTVKSVQNGVVVFSGNLAPTGNTVVVYHGYGIYSYYYHLAENNIQEGYVLNAGEGFAIAGNSGFTNGKTLLHFAMSIDGTFVNPEWFFAE